MENNNKTNKDVTDRYLDMICAFECDFSLAKDDNDYQKIDQLRLLLIKKDKRLLKDIELLEELSFKLRNEKIKLREEN